MTEEEKAAGSQETPVEPAEDEDLIARADAIMDAHTAHNEKVAPKTVAREAARMERAAKVRDSANRERSKDDVIVSVKDVSIVFNIANERMQSLKEYFIKIVKRQLFFKAFTAVDDVSFDVYKGDVFGIVGTNGSGKSTMLKVIAGVLEPTKGTCTVSGSIAPLIELGAGFDMELTARENIYLNGAILGYSRKFLDEHYDEIVDFAELKDFMGMPLKNYSSGMVARIAFAIATVVVPDLLIVDEVLSVGDYMFQEKCENKIYDLIENHGTTVLLVSHNIDQIERMCNRALWIEKSKPRLLGNAQDVVDAYKQLGEQ